MDTLRRYRARADEKQCDTGIVRGYRNQLLTGQNYGNLTQCETIDGMLRIRAEVEYMKVEHMA